MNENPQVKAILRIVNKRILELKTSVRTKPNQHMWETALDEALWIRMLIKLEVEEKKDV